MEKADSYAIKRQPLGARKIPSPKRHESTKKGRKRLRGLWSDDALKEAIKAIDLEYKWEEVYTHYGIPRSSLRDLISRKTISRKMDSTPILSEEEKEGLVKYLEIIKEFGHPLNSSQFNAKVEEMTQLRVTIFRKGIPRDSWLKWFRVRNLCFVLRQPQPLDFKKARAL